MNQVGRFEILEELGRGAYGVVYRALDPAIGRTVAIKSIRFSEFSDPDERRDLRERVLREAQSAGKLSHPNIVTIYDVLESDDLAHIFMEFVDGPSLKDAMRRELPPTREQVLSFVRQIAEALDYAHRKGIIHRDIKPANIMLSDRGMEREGVAKIADFGVAKLSSQESTQQRTLMGTPTYMSPEQLEGAGVGGASDQFALAVVVYELLTGEKPFVAESLAALHHMIGKQTAKPVNEWNPHLSETVNRVMERALAKLPGERYPSCSEFVGALSVAVGECAAWQPMPARKTEQQEKHVGNGWYAPETVASSRLPASGPAVNPGAQQTAVVAPSFGAAAVRPRPAGAKVRVGVQRPAARRLGKAVAGLAVLAVAGVLLFQFWVAPKRYSQNSETRRILPVPSPDDLSVANNPTSVPPADLTTAPATLVVTDAHSSRTTVAVPTPAVPKTEAAPPVEEAASSPPPPHRSAPALSEVEIVSDPPGARVEVDGQAGLGCMAPCSVSLAAGRHTLVAGLDGGYGSSRKIFNVPMAGTVFVPMLRNMGMLLLTSEPAGTSVAIDGRDIGPTPLKLKLPAGKHRLSLSDGLRHHEETIQIDTDGLYARTFRW